MCIVDLNLLEFAYKMLNDDLINTVVEIVSIIIAVVWERAAKINHTKKTYELLLP